MYDNKQFYGKEGRRWGFHPFKALMFVSMFALFVFLLGTVVMLLWNFIMPELFGWKRLNFWQAVALFLLFRILFGGLGRGHVGKRHFFRKRRQYWKEKWMQMDEQEREAFKAKWKNHCAARKMDEGEV